MLRELKSTWLMRILRRFEGNDDVDENHFIDEILNSQKDPDTRIEPESHRERLEEKKSVDLMIIDKEEEEESAGDALIRRKGKELQELMTSNPTPSSSKPTTSSPKPKSNHVKKKDFKAEAVRATLKKVVTSMVDKTINDIMKKNLPKIIANRIRFERQKVQNDLAILVADAVKKERESIRAELSLQHPIANASSSIPDLQHQLYLKMKDDERARDADLAIWLSLKIKLEKPVPFIEPYRVATVRTHDHKDHHDDDARPEGESSAKRQNTSEHVTFTIDDQGVDDDEIPDEEVSPKLLNEVSRKIMNSDELQRMQDAMNDMLRSRCESGDEHQYHLDQMQSYMESQIVWESGEEDLTL
ncbi:hypothetical protein Tco_0394533 [Tanacetum coccineum]